MAQVVYSRAMAEQNIPFEFDGIKGSWAQYRTITHWALSIRVPGPNGLVLYSSPGPGEDCLADINQQLLILTYRLLKQWQDSRTIRHLGSQVPPEYQPHGAALLETEQRGRYCDQFLTQLAELNSLTDSWWGHRQEILALLESQTTSPP